MDGRGFDQLARQMSGVGSRRTVLRAALAASVGALAGSRSLPTAAADVGTAACSGIGARCGRRSQPPCSQCCTSHVIKQNNGQQRCACRPDFGRCDRDDECCGGLCCRFEGRKVCLPGIFAPNGRCPACGCSSPVA